jgi:hypothetical protein
MRNYLNSIEQIPGITLEPEKIQQYDFSLSILQELKDFAGHYAKANRDLAFRDQGISCFVPYADILSGDFRTYHANGSLLNHWPSFEELAGLLLFCDHVIIHDHLEHYASSALDGYVLGYRYNGIRNWLAALAEWRKLIDAGLIGIMPQDLVLSGPVQSIWDEGTIQDAAAEIYYAIYPEEGMIKNGCEAEDLLAGFSAIEDLISTLSIAGNKGGRYAPYFNDAGSFFLHETFVDAVFSLLRHKAARAGCLDPEKMKTTRGGSIARLELSLPLPADFQSAGDLCEILLTNKIVAAMKEQIKLIFKKFSENSSFLLDPPGMFQDYLNGQQMILNNELKSIFPHAQQNPAERKKLYISFAGALVSANPDTFLDPAMSAIRKTLDNMPLKSRLPGSTCHYFVAVI